MWKGPNTSKVWVFRSHVLASEYISVPKPLTLGHLDAPRCGPSLLALVSLTLDSSDVSCLRISSEDDELREGLHE